MWTPRATAKELFMKKPKKKEHARKPCKPKAVAKCAEVEKPLEDKELDKVAGGGVGFSKTGDVI